MITTFQYLWNNSNNTEANMTDSKYFTTTKKGEIFELKSELNNDKKEKKKEAVKKVWVWNTLLFLLILFNLPLQVIASMTVGKDVSALFPDVVNCMQTDNLELKKLVYLYLMNYAKSQPDMAIMAVNTFVKVRINIERFFNSITWPFLSPYCKFLGLFPLLPTFCLCVHDTNAGHTQLICDRLRSAVFCRLFLKVNGYKYAHNRDDGLAMQFAMWSLLLLWINSKEFREESRERR